METAVVHRLPAQADGGAVVQFQGFEILAGASGAAVAGDVDVVALIRSQGGYFFQGYIRGSAQAGIQGAGYAVDVDTARRPGCRVFLHDSRQDEQAARPGEEEAAHVVEAEAIYCLRPVLAARAVVLHAQHVHGSGKACRASGDVDIVAGVDVDKCAAVVEGAGAVVGFVPLLGVAAIKFDGERVVVVGRAVVYRACDDDVS